MRTHYFKHILEATIIVCLLAIIYGSKIESVEFHRDESHWIATSAFFEEFIKLHFSSPVWNKSYWTVTQPPVARYIIGLGRRIGGYRATDLNKPWNYRKNTTINIQHGAMPSVKLLWWSRLPMSVLSVISILIGFVLVKKSAGRVSGYVWVILSVISPFFLTTLRRAMGEASLLVGIMFAISACYQALQVSKIDDRGWLWRTFLWLSLVGVSIGFAGASKLNGLSGLVGGLAVITVIATKLKRPVTCKFLFVVCAALMMTLFTCFAFIGLNPYLWPDPAGRTVNMFQHRVREMRAQMKGHPEARIDTIMKRIRVVPERVFQTNAAINVNGFLFPNIVFFVVGLYRALSISREWLVNKVSDSSPIAILLVGFAAATPSLFTPLDWSRYYLLPVFFTTLFIAIGISWYLNKTYLLSRAVYKRLG